MTGSKAVNRDRVSARLGSASSAWKDPEYLIAPRLERMSPEDGQYPAKSVISRGQMVNAASKITVSSTKPRKCTGVTSIPPTLH